MNAFTAPQAGDTAVFTNSIEGFEQILSPEAVAFLVKLHDNFAPRVEELLAARATRQARYDAGELPDFLPETREIRESEWTIASIPDDLLDRRVEITGPTDSKMLINALNSGANTFMTCFEDAHSPTWQATLEGRPATRWNKRPKLRANSNQWLPPISGRDKIGGSSCGIAPCFPDAI